MPILASDMGGIVWALVAEGSYCLNCLACLIGCILACFNKHRRFVGRIGVVTISTTAALYSLLFRDGVTFGNPFSTADALFIVAITLPPLISIFLIVIGRRDSLPDAKRARQ